MIIGDQFLLSTLRRISLCGLGDEISKHNIYEVSKFIIPVYKENVLIGAGFLNLPCKMTLLDPK